MKDVIDVALEHKFARCLVPKLVPQARIFVSHLDARHLNGHNAQSGSASATREGTGSSGFNISNNGSSGEYGDGRAVLEVLDEASQPAWAAVG